MRPILAAAPLLLTPDRTCSGMALRGLIFSAYRIPAWRLSGGPDWMDTDPWDIAATLPPNMPSNCDELTRQADLMLQALLANRFQLKIHREMRDQPVYELVVAKNGPKLKPSSSDKFSIKMGRGHLEFHHASMAVFIGYLYVGPGYFKQAFQQAADRPVLDKTGLQGFFDFTLDRHRTVTLHSPRRADRTQTRTPQSSLRVPRHRPR